MVSPLDWGLGHASRCVPLIHYLLNAGHRVSVAGSGLSLELLQKNFSDRVTYYRIPGYHITYNKRKGRFTSRIISQLPHIRQTIRKENQWLLALCRELELDGIISDNRYGICHPHIPSVILTHQWQILSGIHPWADRVLLRWHERQLRRFRQVWIVDRESASRNLAGKMSHPPGNRIQDKVRYIGHLSQIIPRPGTASGSDENQVLALLSGPEPARTWLMEAILRQAERLPQYRFKIISGTSGFPHTAASHIEIAGMVPAPEVQKAIESAALVICRSGYSTLMDLLALRAKALLIPTPGQTEQEYLAANLMAQNICYSRSQYELDLQQDIPAAFAYAGFTVLDLPVNQSFRPVLDQWLEDLNP